MGYQPEYYFPRHGAYYGALGALFKTLGQRTDTEETKMWSSILMVSKATV